MTHPSPLRLLSGGEPVQALNPMAVDAHIHWLRLELAGNPARPRLIRFVRGRGYRRG